MRIAVVGGGISGLVAARLLSRDHDVRLFEAQDRLGGHTHTHTVDLGPETFQVDSGFIVFNPAHYPLFCRLLDEIAVASEPSDMSFAVRCDRSGLEYNATSVNRLFCQRRNLLRPGFYRMVADIVRFYRQAPALLESDQPGPTTADWLEQHGYSQQFRDHHLLPMASALWSAPQQQVLEFPIRYMVQFFANHSMLQLSGRSPWRVIRGGSSAYIAPLIRDFADRISLNSPVRRLQALPQGVRLLTDAEDLHFDRVVLACHSDQALGMLAEPSAIQQEILGAIRYQTNETVLHTDTRVLPRRRTAWAAWNARIPESSAAPCTVNYDMNILQGLSAPEEFIVSLNQTEALDPDRIICKMHYQHPVYDHAAVAAQQRFEEIDGEAGLHYCGAWWGWGFHEDGVRSAVRVAERLNGVE